jgi:hypothetical protein
MCTPIIVTELEKLTIAPHSASLRDAETIGSKDWIAMLNLIDAQSRES